MAKKKNKKYKQKEHIEERPPKEPLPLKELMKRSLLVGFAALLVLVVAGIMIMIKVGEVDRFMEARELTVDAAIEGATLEEWDQARLDAEDNNIVWCMNTADGSHVGRAGDIRGNAKSDTWRRLCDGYGPNVYPDHKRTHTRIWEPQNPDEGEEFVIATWNRRGHGKWLQPVKAKAIVIVETFNPGAIVAVDSIDNYYSMDESKTVMGPMKKTRLWSGAMKPIKKSRVSVIRLKDPVGIATVRLVLDTKQARGYNNIDTIGLLTE